MTKSGKSGAPVEVSDEETKAAKAMATQIGRSEDLLLAIFGDHTQIAASPEEIQVVQYDHD